jgi:TonB-dependent receptor
MARGVLMLSTAFGMGAFVPAHGQESAKAEAGAAEEIVVIGQRLRQQRALDVRRDSDAIVDAIAADEIGRLADKNVAESIERLPGVSLKYDQGEGRFVTLRGIDGALNNVTVNGVDLGSPDGDTRQLPLDVIGGQLLSRVTVVKAVTPDMDAQAIGGSVDIELQSPFDFDKPFILRATAQAGSHELNDTTPYAGDFAIGGVFGGQGQFGVLLGASYQERDFRSYGLFPDDWAATPGTTRGRPVNVKYTTYDLLRQRTGAAASFEWRPGDDHRVYLQTLYSSFKEDETRQRYRLDFGTVTPNADGVRATATGGERRQDLRLEKKDKSILNVTLGSEHTLGVWKLDGLVSYGHNQLDEPNKVWLFRSGGLPGGAISSNLDFGPLLYTATPVADAPASALQFRQLTVQRNVAEENILTGEFNVRRDLAFGENSYLQFGARLRDAEKEQDNANDRYDRGTTNANRFTLANFGLQGQPTATLLDDTTYPNPVTIDAAAIQAYTDANLGGPTIVLNSAVTLAAELSGDYNVEERVSAGYAMANLDFGRLSLLGGVRIERTETSVTTPLPTVSSLSNAGEYTNILPGLQARYEGDNNIVLRGALTQTLGRPAYGQLSPAASINTVPATPVISRGDPGLEPYLSTNIDAAFDWYFAPGGVFGVGVFHKTIKDYIFTRTTPGTNVTFQTITYPSVLLSQPANAGEADVTGIEVNYQQQFEFLPGAFSGLGIAANLTLTDSNVDVEGRGTLALPRQSDRVWGVQLFYQKYGFEGALAYHYTSAYLDTVGASAAVDTYFNRFRRVDAKVSYALTPRLKVFVEGQNLNDETLWEYQGGRPDWLIGYEQYGRTTYLGLSANW